MAAASRPCHPTTSQDAASETPPTSDRRPTPPRARAGLDLRAEVAEGGLQRREEERHVRRAAAIPHQADPPGLALVLAQAAADLDAPLAEQALADGQVVDPVGDPGAGQLREAMALLRDQADPHRREAGLEGVAVEPMPGVAGFQPLLDDQRQSLPQRVVHADRRRVVVDPVASPVFLDHLHIQIPAPDLGLAIRDDLGRAGVAH